MAPPLETARFPDSTSEVCYISSGLTFRVGYFPSGPVSPLTRGPANDIPQPPDFLDLPTSWTALSSIFSGYARPSRFSWSTTPSRFPRPSRPASVSRSSQPARPARALVSDSCQTKLSAATTAGAATYIQVAAVTAGSKPASWSCVSSGSMAGSVAICLLLSCPVAGLHLCHLASALHPCHQYPTLHSCLRISVLASCRQSPVLASCYHHLPQPLVARSSLVLLFCGSQALPAPRWFCCLSKTSCFSFWHIPPAALTCLLAQLSIPLPLGLWTIDNEGKLPTPSYSPVSWSIPLT